MKRFRRILLSSLCSLASLSLGQGLSAQIGLPIGQYLDLLPHLNPAAIGLGDELSLRAIHNRQLEGLEGASKSFLVMGDMPLAMLGGRHSAGVQMSNEVIGLFKDTELTGRYAIRTRLGKGYLQVGVGGSIISSTFEGSKIFIPEGIEGMAPADAALPVGNVSGRGFDAHLGAYYSRANFWIGISVSQLLGLEIMLDNRYYRDRPRGYSLVAGYRSDRLTSRWRWSTALLAQIDERAFYRLDLRLDAWWDRRFKVGAFYRHRSAVGLTLGLQLGRAYVGYQYELPSTALRAASWGNHELLVGYSMPIDLSGKKTATYKSARLL